MAPGTRSWVLAATILGTLWSCRAQNTCSGNCRSTLINHSHLEGTIFATYVNVGHMIDCCEMCQQNSGCMGFNYCPSGSSNGGGCMPFQSGNGRSADGGACELLYWGGDPAYNDNSIFNRQGAWPNMNLWQSGLKACNLPEPPPSPPSGYWGGLNPAQTSQGGRRLQAAETQ